MSTGAPPLVLDAEGFDEAFPDESHHIEWKRGVSLDAIEAAAVAFSNADGGVLQLGVEDDGTVVGKPLTSDVELRIHRAMGRAHGLGKYEIRDVLVGEVPITVISVSSAREGVAQTHDGRPLIRRGKQNVALVGEELSLLASSRSRTRYERSATSISLGDADPERLRVLQTAFAWGDGAELVDRLREHHLVGADSPPRLTVAGALYLLADPTDSVGRADIVIYRFPEMDGDYDKRQVIAGPLDRQVTDATGSSSTSWERTSWCWVHDDTNYRRSPRWCSGRASRTPWLIGSTNSAA